MQKKNGRSIYVVPLKTTVKNGGWLKTNLKHQRLHLHLQQVQVSASISVPKEVDYDTSPS